MATLPELREKIDRTDDSLVELLNQRAKLVLQVKEAKEKAHVEIYSPERERQIVERVLELGAKGEFPKSSLEKIFREVVSATRSLIGELLVGYLGPEFSLAHCAALKQFGEQVKYSPSYAIEELFRKVEAGEAHYGIVPLESSSGGAVTATLSAFMDSSLKIIAEVSVKEQLDLVARETGLSEVKKVYGDSESFGRAMKWLKANLPAAELVLADNSASAAKLAGEKKGVAAILLSTFSTDGAPATAGGSFGGLGERYKLATLANAIGDSLEGIARYVVIGPNSPAKAGRDKTSLICSIKDQAGALCEILKPFQSRKLNLTKIESKPMPQRSLEYVFLLDVMGHSSEPQLSEAIAELGKLSSFLKVLGSYPASC